MSPPSHEDRFILVQAPTEDEARRKGEQEGERYEQRYLNGDGESVARMVRGISEVQAIVDNELRDGTDVYSGLVDGELADLLMRPRDGPLRAWERSNPERDSGRAKVGEVLDAWNQPDPE